MSTRALGTGLAAAAAFVLLGPTAAVARGGDAPARPPSVAAAQAFGSFDNPYDVGAGGSVTDTLAALGADDLLVYETLTVGALSPASAGTLTVDGTYPSGTFTFTAAPRFSGTAAAEYVGETADGERLTAAIVFTVAPGAPTNRPPVVRPDAIAIVVGSTASVNPLANDSDPDDGDLLTLTGVSPSSLDGVTVQTAGTTIRVRAAGAAAPGVRRFRYTIADRAGATAVGTLHVSVRARPTTTTTTTRPTRPPTSRPATPTAPPASATTRPRGSTAPIARTDASSPDTESDVGPDRTSTSSPRSTGATAGTTDTGGPEPRPGQGSPRLPIALPADADLPSTGSNAGNPVIAAIVLVALGLGFVALAGRRRLHRSG